jgi:hypothetical protein
MKQVICRGKILVRVVITGTDRYITYFQNVPKKGWVTYRRYGYAGCSSRVTYPIN